MHSSVDRLVKAALEGRRLEASCHFPVGSFPPVVIAELLEAAQGFNPEKEFPRGASPSVAFPGWTSATGTTDSADSAADLQRC